MKKLLIMLILLLFSCGGVEPIDVFDPTRDFSWSHIDTNGDGVYEDYVSPIKRQPCSDCFIYAATGLLEMQFQIDHKLSVYIDLSEQNLHNCTRTTCTATGDPRPFLEHFKRYGAIEEQYVKTGKWGTCDNCKSHLHNGVDYFKISDVPFYRLKKWKMVYGINISYKDKRKALMDALKTGPIVMTIGSWDGFKRDGDTAYCAGRWISGSHAVVVVGYKNNGEAFLIKNSHGEKYLIKMVFKDGDKCGFGNMAAQIEAGSTYVSYGSGESYCYSTDDFDADLIPNVHDNCPWTANHDQKNKDKDMLGDACDPCPEDYDVSSGFYCDSKK